MLRLCLILATLLAGLIAPAAAQDDCADALPPRLTVGQQGVVAVAEGFFLNVRAEPSRAGAEVVRLARGEVVDILDGPTCVEGFNWWEIGQFNLRGWVAEAAGRDYLLDPFDAAALPTLPPGPAVPVTDREGRPNQLSLDNGLPVIVPTDNPDALETTFFTWDWAVMLGETPVYGPPAPDPRAVRLPQTYQGDMPTGPFDLDAVRFVEDADLNEAQRALLAQNGFVVVPGGRSHFEDVYRWDDAWSPEEGKPYWVTTDSVLHALHVAFDNLLTFLEQEELIGRVREAASAGYEAAAAQHDALRGTDLETVADGVAVYYAVAVGLLDPDRYADIVRADHAAEAAPLIAAAVAGEGRLPVPFLGERYDEDFSQYQPRGSYNSDEGTQRYFRGMMWLGRITFLAHEDETLLGGLLTLRALIEGGGYASWQAVAETLEFLIGPEDNLGPARYLPPARAIFGDDLSLDALADPDRLDQFRDAVAVMPGPRIYNVVRPMGTQEDELDDATRGFRLFGGRFTFDGYAMQRLIYPAVGEVGRERILPSGLDVASALGSDVAYALLDAAGDTDYLNYTNHMAELRVAVNQIAPADWLTNVYGGWMWALQPLWARRDEAYPPLLNTEAWKLRDIHAGLASWAELKHDTLLYTVQPMGGLGGGGERTVTAYSMIEPNPYVFARVAIAASVIEQGLEARGFNGVSTGQFGEPSGLMTVHDAFRTLKVLSAQLAEMARKELWGEPLTDDDQLFLKYDFGNRLWYVRYMAEITLAEPPEMAAIVADIASNPDAGVLRAVGTGFVDLIYVITPGPDGPQLARGSAYSFYEFTLPIDQRPTDEAWRDQLRAGQAPPRPDWVSAFYSE